MDMSMIRRQRSFDSNPSEGGIRAANGSGVNRTGDPNRGDNRCSGGGVYGNGARNSCGRSANIDARYKCGGNAGCGGNGSSGKINIAKVNSSTDSAGSCGVGGGEGIICDQTAKVLGVAFLSIAQSVARTEEGMRSIEGKIQRTDEAVRNVSQDIKEQGERMQKLEERMNDLEKKIQWQPRSNPSSSSRPCRPREQSANRSEPVIPEKVNPVPPGSTYPTQPSPVISVNSCSVLSTFQVPRPYPPPPRSVSCNTCNQQTIRSCCAERFANLGRHLLKVAHEGRAKDVRKLLDDGADVNFPNSSKWTPLHRAAAKAHPEVVSLLLKRGADVNAKTSYGFTPLHTAACNDFSGQCVTMLIDAWSNLDNQDRSLRTPLHYAAAYGNEAAVRALVAAGASRTAQDDEGWTPYDVARAESVRRLLGF